MSEIKHERFRQGLWRHFSLTDASPEEKETAIRDVEEKWWFCGGRDTQPNALEDEETDPVSEKVIRYWNQLWRHHFPDRPMPSKTGACICKQEHLRYNCYLTNGQDILVLGRVCIQQFLPNQAKNMMSRRCDSCATPHRNRKDNFCKECRTRMEEEEKKNAEEKRKITCYCGNRKKPEYEVCFGCHAKQTTCACGKWKKKEYKTCYTCKMGYRPRPPLPVPVEPPSKE